MAAKAYRGVLKARISKLYGGDVTITKVKKLKARHAKIIARGKMSAAWWADKVKW